MSFKTNKMKTLTKILILQLFIILFNKQTIKAQCHIDDWTALKALYESTNGDFWTTRTGWGTVLGDSPPPNCDLEILYGITLDAEGRVFCIDLDDETNGGCGYSGNGADGNNLSGFIPIEIEKLVQLTKLFLSNNNLSGNIPTEIGNLSLLENLYLRDNEFISGFIPAEIGNLSNLIHLSLGYNQLSGNIPVELSNLSNLLSLGLAGNQLTGSIPPQLENLSELTHLYLENNEQLNGNIPPELGNLNKLETLRLWNNQFNGNIPPELGNLSSLKRLYLWNNHLSGEIPAELGNLNNLEVLQLEYNNLNGSIPPELGNLSSLAVLRIDSNKINGNIPSELSNLNLGFFNCQNNMLEGCFYPTLTNLCSTFTDAGHYIDNGNSFDALWDDFCATGAGACDPVCGCTDPTACNYNPIATCDDGNCQENCETLVYPGDLNHDGIVDNQDVALSGLYLNNYGIARAQEHQNIDWYPHPSQDWGFENNQNVDLKHHDCNGDGLLDLEDQQAITLNMDSIWGIEESEDAPEQSDYLVLLQPIDQVIDGYLIMNVVLERRANADLEVQAGYFTIDYSEIEGNISFATLAFFDENWLGERDVNVWYERIEFPQQKKIDVGFTKIDNLSSNGSGVIAQLILNFDTNVAKRGESSNVSYQFSISDVGIHNNNSQFTLVENQQLNVIVNPDICYSNLVINKDSPFQNLYQSSGNITTNGFVLIGEDQQVEYKANRVTLNSGFSIKVGEDSRFKAGYGNCD